MESISCIGGVCATKAWPVGGRAGGQLGRGLAGQHLRWTTNTPLTSEPEARTSVEWTLWNGRAIGVCGWPSASGPVKGAEEAWAVIRRESVLASRVEGAPLYKGGGKANHKGQYGCWVGWAVPPPAVAAAKPVPESKDQVPPVAQQTRESIGPRVRGRAAARGGRLAGSSNSSERVE